MKVLTRTTVLATLASALFALGCGRDDPPHTPAAPIVAPSPAVGKGVLSGTVVVQDRQCVRNGYVIMTVHAQSTNVLAYNETIPTNGNYIAQLDPGSYVLTANAPPCVYAQPFTISEGQSLIITPVLL